MVDYSIHTFEFTVPFASLVSGELSYMIKWYFNALVSIFNMINLTSLLGLDMKTRTDIQGFARSGKRSCSLEPSIRQVTEDIN